MTDSSFTVKREAWMIKANCADKDKSLFILDKGHSTTEALKICRSCTVRDPCYEYGVKSGSVGVWGGRLLTFKPEDTEIELYPIRDIRDFRAEPIREEERKKTPMLLETPYKRIIILE